MRRNIVPIPVLYTGDIWRCPPRCGASWATITATLAPATTVLRVAIVNSRVVSGTRSEKERWLAASGRPSTWRCALRCERELVLVQGQALEAGGRQSRRAPHLGERHVFGNAISRARVRQGTQWGY